MSKIITQNGIVKYVFNDIDNIDIQEHRIITPGFVIGDLNSNNCTFFENITDTPDDFIGDKYLYDGINWSINSQSMIYFDNLNK